MLQIVQGLVEFQRGRIGGVGRVERIGVVFALLKVAGETQCWLRGFILRAVGQGAEVAPGLAQLGGLAGQPRIDRRGRGVEQPPADPPPAVGPDRRAGLHRIGDVLVAVVRPGQGVWRVAAVAISIAGTASLGLTAAPARRAPRGVAVARVGVAAVGLSGRRADAPHDVGTVGLIAGGVSSSGTDHDQGQSHRGSSSCLGLLRTAAQYFGQGPSCAT